MKIIKNILPFITIAIMMLFGACSNEEAIEIEPAATRTISLTVAIEDDNPNTRVSLDEKVNGGVALKWEANDVLNLAFVQEATTVNGTATATTITNDGKRANFTIDVPTAIDVEAPFNLYGVYGGGALSGTTVTLPTQAGSATSLADVQTRDDVMLYFKSESFDVANPPTSVTFKPLGSFFKITVKNSSDTESLNNLQEARLVGINNTNNANWAYNAGAGGKTFDLMTEKFQDTESGSNFLSFKAANSTLSAGETISFWAWYPPITYEVAWNKKHFWPELQLQLIDATTEALATSTNSKPARTTQTAAGRSYYFFAAWNGTQLEFTDDSFSSELGPNEYFVPEGVSLESILGEDINTITTMIIKGYLNTADFSILKKMPNLSYLDLKDVTCPDNKIPNSALGGNKPNKSITTLILPKSVTAIGKLAFKNCGLLVNLTLPPNLVTIDKEAFQNCSSMTGTLIFPTTLTSIGEYGFTNCTSVTAFRFPHDTLFPYSTKMLHKDDYNVGGATVQVPTTLLGDYKAATHWSAHAANIVAIP